MTAKAKYGFYPKRWEEREIPVPTKSVEILEQHPKFPASPFVFPSHRHDSVRLLKPNLHGETFVRLYHLPDRFAA